MHPQSKSDSYAAAGVDITAGYKAVELMKNTLPARKTKAASMTSGGSAAASDCPLPVWKNRFWSPAPTVAERK